MTWGYSKEETTDSLKHKSYAVRKAFADAANATLNRGLDIEAAEFAGYAAVSRLERKQSEESQTALDLIKKQNKPPAHLAAVLEAARVKQAELTKQAIQEQQPLPEFKQITSIDFNKQGYLVVVFDDGSTITTKHKVIEQIDISQYVSLAPTVRQKVFEPVTVYNNGDPQIVFTSDGDIVMTQMQAEDTL